MTAPRAFTPTLIEAPLHPRGSQGQARQLVVHAMGEHIINRDPQWPIGTIAAWDWLKARGLSAHALIAPDGTITECVPRDQRAFHALGHNSGTLGVELLVAGTHTYDSLALALGWDLRTWAPADPLPPDPYGSPQYTSLAWWLAREAAALCLTWDAVTSHDRLDRSRKFDPGPCLSFDRVNVLFGDFVVPEAD